MADSAFTQFKKVFLDRSDAGGGVDFDTDTIKVILITVIPLQANVDAWNFYSDVTNELAAGAGYTQGGIALTGVVVAADTVNHRASFDASDSTWAAFSATGILGCILYKSTGVAGTSRVIGTFDFGGSKSGTGGNFTIQWNAAGIYLLT